MQTKFISNKDSRRLLIVFGGWGMAPGVFADIDHPSFDVLAVWDYRNADFDYSITDRYDEVCVVAWSMGVRAAIPVIDHLSDKVTRSIAVNGTVNPVDDDCGIPRNVFDATLRNMSDENLKKFYRRMGDDGRVAEACACRSIDEKIEELRVFAALPHTDANPYDLAVISTDDHIFPIDNQRRAWEGVQSIEVDAGHLPDLLAIVNRYVVDKPLVEQRFSVAQPSYDLYAIVQRDIAHTLWDAMRRHHLFPQGVTLEVGPGSGIFTKVYTDPVEGTHHAITDLRLWDIATPTVELPESATFTQCDAELAIRRLPDASIDCIVSNCCIQWFGSPRRFLQECLRVLRPGGFVALSTFDANNLAEVRRAGVTAALTLPDLDQWRDIVPRGLLIKELRSYDYELIFTNPRLVLDHLKGTGANAVSRQTWSPASLQRFIDAYPRDNQNLCHLTYRPLLLILVK